MSALSECIRNSRSDNGGSTAYPLNYFLLILLTMKKYELHTEGFCLWSCDFCNELGRLSALVLGFRVFCLVSSYEGKGSSYQDKHSLNAFYFH